MVPVYGHADVVVQGRSRDAKKQGQLLPVLEQIVDRSPQTRVGFHETLVELTLQPSAQLLDHWPAVRLVKDQSLLGRKVVLARRGVIRIDGCERLQHVAAFGRETFMDLDELASAMRQAKLAMIIWSSSGMFRDNASHIWIGGGKSVAPRRSTSRKFSPACCGPLKNSTIRTSPEIATTPEVNSPLRDAGSTSAPSSALDCAPSSTFDSAKASCLAPLPISFRIRTFVSSWWTTSPSAAWRISSSRTGSKPGAAAETISHCVDAGKGISRFACN